MVHIHPETLRRHPILGVILGGVTAIVLGCLLRGGWDEARALLAQKAPESLSVHEIATLHGARWVTLAAGQWHCDQAITIERSPGIERWLRGKVESTEVPITAATDEEVVVAHCDGAVKCEERAGSSLTGVVGSTNIFGNRATLRRWRSGGNRVAVLQVGASPLHALILLIALAAIFIGGIVFAGHYLMLMLRSGRRQEVRLPVTGLLQPS